MEFIRTSRRLYHAIDGIGLGEEESNAMTERNPPDLENYVGLTTSRRV
jgi:hypothetical protein